MLDKTTFLKGLKYLNAYYANFNFNINDDYKIGVWYNIFKGVSNETYTTLIKNYSEKNIYAPQSPTHLLEHVKEAIIESKPTPEAAWTIALDTLRSTGYNFKRTYEKIEDGNIVRAIMELRVDLDGIMTKDIPFVRNHFIEIYKREIKKEVELTTKEALISKLQTMQNLLPEVK